MSKIIIYGSNYGTTQQYAEELSERTGIRAICYDLIKDITSFDTIIYLGGLYAGGVKGLKNITKLISKNNQSKIIIITVGLADVTDEENTKSIKKSIKMQIPVEIYDKAEIFHLRGGINYRKLNFKHKTMIQTFNQQVDFIDFDNLNQIIDVI